MSLSTEKLETLRRLHSQCFKLRDAQAPDRRWIEYQMKLAVLRRELDEDTVGALLDVAEKGLP